MMQRILIYVAIMLGFVGTYKLSLATQTTLTDMPSLKVGNAINVIGTNVQGNTTKQNTMNTELYAADSLKANTSCFGSEAAFNACFPMDWPTGFDVSADYTVTGSWDFSGATVTGISGVNYTAGTNISISDGVISLSWDKDYADLINTPEFIDFSATSPLNFNSTTGVLSLTPWESQSALEAWLGWSFSGGGGITVSSTLPTTAGSATLNDSTHVLTVASDTGYTQFTGSFTAWDTTPTAFGFGTITDAVAGDEYCWTTPVTVSGINRPATVASTATSYKINGSTSTATTINAGDTITPCLAASTTPSATVSGNLTLGGVAGSPVFSVTTAAAPLGNYDIFTGTDNTSLTTHDANWGSLNTRLVANCKLIDNALVPSTTYGTCGARYTTSTSDISEAVLVAQAATGSIKKVHVRASDSSFGYDAYLGIVSGGNTTTVAINKNNTFFDSCNFTAAWNTDRTLRVVASGTSPVIITVYVNGTQVCQKTDATSPITSGNPGLSIVGDGSYTDAKIDNWKDN